MNYIYLKLKSAARVGTNCPPVMLGSCLPLDWPQVKYWYISRRSLCYVRKEDLTMTGAFSQSKNCFNFGPSLQSGEGAARSVNSVTELFCWLISYLFGWFF